MSQNAFKCARMVDFHLRKSKESEFSCFSHSLRISQIRLCFCTTVNNLMATATSTASAIKKRSVTAAAASDENDETDTTTDTHTDSNTDTNTDTNTDSYGNTTTNQLATPASDFPTNDDSDCGLVCPGNFSEICGGPNSVRIYSTGISANLF